MHQRIAPAQRTGQPDSQRRNQRHGNDVGGDPAGIVRESNDLFRRKKGHQDDQYITTDHVGVQRMPQYRTHHTEHDNRTDGQRNQQTQRKTVDASTTDDLGLSRHRDQRRLGDDRRKPQRETEDHEQGQ